MDKDKRVKNYYGATARNDLLSFDPKDLDLITDEKHALYDRRAQQPLTEEFIQSIMEQGVLQPIVVFIEGNRPKVVMGRRRVLAARQAQSRLKRPVLVPAMRFRGSPEVLASAMIAENEHRQADSILGKAEKARRLANMGMSMVQIGVVFGCTDVTARGWIQLDEACSAVRKAVEKEEISVAVAMQLAKLPAGDQPAKLKIMKESGATKGAAGLEAAKTLRRTGKVGKNGAVNMLSRKFLKSLIENLPEEYADLIQVLLGEKPINEAVPVIDAAVTKTIEKRPHV